MRAPRPPRRHTGILPRVTRSAHSTVASVPAPFVRALRTWLCGVPAATLAPQMLAAARLLEGLVPGDGVALSEAQLRRIAARETPLASEDDALGASVVLDLWQATRAGRLRTA